MIGSRTLWMGVSFALFHAAWFACVIGAARGHVAFGVSVIAALIVALLSVRSQRAVELRLLALAVAVGVVWDSMLLRMGLVAYASPGPLPGWAPVWILALWALFAAMLREPLRWLHGRPVLAALFGAVGGPLSYAAAERLGAGTMPDRALALTVLAIGWALLVPLLLLAAQRWERGPRQIRVAATSVGARS
jgi:hypothetical protein